MTATMATIALPDTVDIAIVGAGTAGAATAAFAAARGFRVACVDRRPLADAGARWVNGVTRAALRELQIDALPDIDPPARFHLLTSRQRVTVDHHDVVDVDMRALVAHLHARALTAGAMVIGDVVVRGRDGATLITDRGRIRARWLVDASGLTGAGLLPVPAIAPQHLCAAAQAVYEVDDRDRAAEYFANHGVGLGEVCAHVGVAGGYSVCNVRLHGDGHSVGVLTGSIPALGHRSGKAILDQFVGAQPWIGARQYGGAGAIPLRRPRDELTDGVVALVGDVGCQVFPAHGSGIGAGMLAGKLLADTLAADGTLFDYELAWHRRCGGLFAAYDAVRRWNQVQTVDDIDRMIRRGLFDVEFARAGLDQDWPQLTREAISRKFPGALYDTTVVQLAARTTAARALGERFPPRGRRRAAWSAIMQRLIPV
jgi:menaquinone-9 beta-reductase